jgi:hypothetical protein
MGESPLVSAVLEPEMLLDQHNRDATRVGLSIDNQQLIDGAGLAVDPLCAFAF